MAQIPSHVIQGQRNSGADIPDGVFHQTSRALGNLMSAANGVPQALKAELDKAQDLKNRSDIMDGRNALRTAQAQFQQEMMGDPANGVPSVPPHEWVGRWGEKLKELKGGLRKISEVPVVLRSLEESYKTFEGTSSIQISGNALKENLSLYKANLDRDMRYNYSVGDWEGNTELIESARPYMGDEVTDDLHRMNQSTENKSERNRSIIEDPAGHMSRVESGEYGPLSKLDKEIEKKKAQQMVDQKSAQSLQEISDIVAQGNVDEDEVQTMIANDPDISENDGKKFMASFRRTRPLTDDERHVLDDRIDGLTKLRYTEEYEEEYFKVMKEMALVQDNDNRPQVNLWNLRPEVYGFEAGKELSEEQRYKELKPLRLQVNDYIRDKVSGNVDARVDNTAIKPDKNKELTPEEKRLNAFDAQRFKEQSTAIRSALSDLANSYISSFPDEQIPTTTDVINYMDKHANEVIVKTIDELDSGEYLPPGGGPGILPKIQNAVPPTEQEIEDKEKEDRANKWLGDTLIDPQEQFE